MKIIRRILIFILICFSCVALKAEKLVYANGYILMEASSKRILEGENINKRYLTASICKILTAIITIENTNIDEYVLITKDGINQTGSSIYMKENDMLTIRDLLYGLMLRSGNDCAYIIANHVAGSSNNFAIMMNNYAKMIGMKNSTFSNPSGLDETSYNYSTPYDMALLMAYAMENKVFREIVGSKKYYTKSLDNQNFYFYNKHKLVQKYDYIIGGKTGYTELAGRTLVSYASKDGMDLICVTFKSSNDWNEHISLFEMGFKNYTLKTVLTKGIIQTNNNYKFTPYLENDIYLPLTKTEKTEIDIYLLNNPLDKYLGKVVISINGQEVVTERLVKYY